MWDFFFFPSMESSSWTKMVVPSTSKVTLHPLMKHWLSNHNQQRRNLSKYIYIYTYLKKKKSEANHISLSNCGLIYGHFATCPDVTVLRLPKLWGEKNIYQYIIEQQFREGLEKHRYETEFWNICIYIVHMCVYTDICTHILDSYFTVWGGTKLWPPVLTSPFISAEKWKSTTPPSPALRCSLILYPTQLLLSTACRK